MAALPWKHYRNRDKIPVKKKMTPTIQRDIVEWESLDPGNGQANAITTAITCQDKQYYINYSQSIREGYILQSPFLRRLKREVKQTSSTEWCKTFPGRTANSWVLVKSSGHIIDEVPYPIEEQQRLSKNRETVLMNYSKFSNVANLTDDEEVFQNQFLYLHSIATLTRRTQHNSAAVSQLKTGLAHRELTKSGPSI